jgi:hypothetical protein
MKQGAAQNGLHPVLHVFEPKTVKNPSVIMDTILTGFQLFQIELNIEILSK